MKLGDITQTGDWKAEKHVPAISAPDHAKAGEKITVEFCVGHDIAHPNTPQHHISWIKLFFVPNGGKFAIELADEQFVAHSASLDDKPGPAATEPFGSVRIALSTSGTLIAQSYCNLHGLWESSKEITID